MPGHRPLIAAACALVAGLAAALALLLSGSSGRSRASEAPAPGLVDSATGFAGAELPASAPAPPLALRDLAGRPVSLSSFRGQVVVLAFVSTRCGAPCVVVAQQIRGALDELPRPVPVLLVSADPVGDNPARARAFLARVSLAGRALYLRGSKPELQAIWRAYGVHPRAAGPASFARELSVRLIGPDGRQRVLFGLEQLTPEGLSHDIRKLGHGGG